jgi:hypothetical protein
MREVLPRGKLERDGNPAAGAPPRSGLGNRPSREGVRVSRRAITYRARGRPKVVQFWRMKAAERPSRDIMKDIVAVEWLPLAPAVRRLSYPLEKLFLHHFGRRILRRRRRKTARRKAAQRRTAKPRHRKTAIRRR